MSISSDIKKMKILYKEYLKTLIIIKTGTFYRAYAEDAEIISFLLNYKLNEEKDGTKYIGFPEKVLEENIEILEEKQINYCIFSNIRERKIKYEKKFGNQNTYDENQIKAYNYVKKIDLVNNIMKELEKNKYKPFFEEMVNEINKVIKQSELEELKKIMQRKEKNYGK